MIPFVRPCIDKTFIYTVFKDLYFNDPLSPSCFFLNILNDKRKVFLTWLNMDWSFCMSSTKTHWSGKNWEENTRNVQTIDLHRMKINYTYSNS